mgnify:CR=1 FL=1
MKGFPSFFGEALQKKKKDRKKGIDKGRAMCYNSRAKSEPVGKKLFEKNKKSFQKPLDKPFGLCYNKQVADKSG